MIKDRRFRVVEKYGNPLGTTGAHFVLQDITTGVLYLFIQIGYAGGLTVLVDGEGKPLVEHVED